MDTQRTRRAVLRNGVRAIAAASLGSRLRAANPGNIDRAVVCIYLFGGNDSNSMIVPLESGQFSSYSSIRGSLAIPRSSLMPISDRSSQVEFGLHPSLARIHNLFQTNAAAFVSNVGPGLDPDRAGPRQGFKHHDSDLSYFPNASVVPGWAASLAKATPTRASKVITGFSKDSSLSLVSPDSNPSSDMRAQVISSATGAKLRTPFPETGLGKELRQVASILAAGGAGITRPVFLATLGGFDTHSRQAEIQTELFAELSDAVGAFYDATVELGISQRVTTYTDSEFNRSLLPNTQGGTDDGWGGHQIVVGGDVLGGRVYGDFPALIARGPNDAFGNGSWTPGIARERYLGTIAAWYGVRRSDLPGLFPSFRGQTLEPLSFLG